MTAGTTPGRRRWSRPRVVVPALLVAFVVAVLVGGQLPRAETIGSYRPVLPPPAFAGACDPFPAGFDLDLAYQVRADRTLVTGDGPVRRLDLHYDLLDADEVRERLAAAAAAAGFASVEARPGADPDVQDWYELAGWGRLGVGVAPFDGADDDTVRGALTLDVPTSTLTPAVRAACDDPTQTKRFEE